MTAALMTFLFLVSCLSAVAAWLAEHGLRGFGLPARLAWLGALLAGPVLLAAGTLIPAMTPAGPSAGLPAAVVELPAMVVAGGAAVGATLDGILMVCWAVSTLGVAVFLWGAHRRLARDARTWRKTRVSGRKVCVSRDLGPAVAGVLRSRIVLPEWALELPERQLRLVLAHEEEHLAARDPALLALAVCLVAGTAWNPVSWWMLRRLRSATEVDCDRRVLATSGGVRAYGESLLTVAARASTPRLPVAAFTEPPLSLERRLMTMTSRISNRTRAAGALLMAIGVLVGAQACAVDSPLEQDGADVPANSEIADGPTFTPFTDPPEIVNRDEVIAALQAEYPPLLREAGIGGTARVYFFIDETGATGDVRIDRSSGHEALDRAALRVAEVYRFQPALNRGDPVPVWVSFPITFVASQS